MTNTTAADWTQRYEDLRAHTLGSLATIQSQAWGLVVFVQQGMRGWMRAWQDPACPAREPTAPAHTFNRSLNNVPEATLLLANMSLRCLGLSL
ncbi:MAG: hypothetical protein ACLQVY_07285 [Limisphaerales bacterium]